jgi:hypothetical protein
MRLPAGRQGYTQMKATQIDADENLATRIKQPNKIYPNQATEYSVSIRVVNNIRVNPCCNPRESVDEKNLF